MTQSFTAARAASNPAIASGDVWGRDTASGASGSTTTELQAALVTDTAVAATASQVAQAAAIDSLQSQMAVLNQKGGLLGYQAPGSTLANSITDTQLSNYAADATNIVKAGDKFSKLTMFTVINTSGSSVNATIKEKIAGANTLQWINFPFASLAGVYLCWLYLEYTIGQSTPNTDHRQFGWLHVVASPDGDINGTATSYTGTPPTLNIYPRGQLSSSSDYGLTQPQIEGRFAFATAAATISMKRLESTLSLLRS